MKNIKVFKIGNTKFSLKEASCEYYYLYADDIMICAYERYVVTEDEQQYAEFLPSKLKAKRRFNEEEVRIALKRCKRYFDKKAEEAEEAEEAQEAQENDKA